MLSSIYFEVLVFQWYILFSTGKDDKNWGGHYGVIVSNSVVRVKREVQSAKGDKFEDIELVTKFYLVKTFWNFTCKEYYSIEWITKS